MRISDWSSDVCSSDLSASPPRDRGIRPSGSVSRCSQPHLHQFPKPGQCRRVERFLTCRTREGLGNEGLQHQLLEIARAPVWTPVTNAHLVCRLLLEKKDQPNNLELRDRQLKLSTLRR